MLGYNFSDEDNIEFISDENLVVQGKAIFSKLAEGMNASLEVVAKNNKLLIQVNQGVIRVKIIDEKRETEKNFQLGAMSKAFADFLKPYISVQFISKGRNFDRHLLMDICSDISKCVNTFEKRSENLMATLRSKSDALRSTVSLSQGVDLSERRDAIQTDLDDSLRNKQSLDNDLTGIQFKIEAASKITEKLTSLESLKSFKFTKTHLF